MATWMQCVTFSSDFRTSCDILKAKMTKQLPFEFLLLMKQNYLLTRKQSSSKAQTGVRWRGGTAGQEEERLQDPLCAVGETRGLFLLACALSYMAREKRDVQRVLRGSAAPRLVGVPKKWSAEQAEEEARRRADKSAAGNALVGHGANGTNVGDGEEDGKKQGKRRCEHPEEAKTDERYQEGDTTCHVCGGALPAVLTFETAASRARTQRLRGMDGVVGWKTAAKGRVWEDVGLHVAHGRATAAQRPQQVEVAHGEMDPQVQYEKGVSLEVASGREGRPKADRHADLRKAAGWFRAAAFQGHTKSAFKLAMCHLTGHGAPYMPDQGVAFLERCALVEPDAAYELAVCYQKGIGAAMDASKAENWFRYAAELGHMGAQMIMVRGDSETSGGLRAQFESIQRRSRKGDAEAQYQVASHLMDGRMIARNEAGACKLYFEAAMQGHAAAMCAYGLCCLHGRGTRVNVEDALRWLEVAAGAGHGVAQLELAYLLEDGERMPKDDAAAQVLRLKAASWSDRGIAEESFRFAKPVGGFISARAIDMVPYLKFCAIQIDELKHRLAVNTLARHLLCSLMRWRRIRPAANRPLLIEQRDWRRSRAGMERLEADISSRTEPTCLLLGLDVHPVLLEEAEALAGDVAKMSIIVDHAVGHQGGRLKQAVGEMIEHMREQKATQYSLSNVAKQQGELGMLHLVWDQDQVEDPKELLDVGNNVEFVVRFDRAAGKLMAGLITKSWTVTDSRPGLTLVRPSTMDDQVKQDQKRAGEIGEKIRKVNRELLALSEGVDGVDGEISHEERVEHVQRRSVLEREKAMLETEQGIVSGRTAGGAGRPWWEELWGHGGVSRQHPIYDREDIMLADGKFRDCGLGRVRGIVSEVTEGDADAQFELGYRYITGKGVPRDDVKGVYWLEKAAAQAQRLAQCALGVCCHLGTGMKRVDEERARTLLNMAAEQGVPLAHTYLADLSKSSSSCSAAGAADMLDSLKAAYTSSTKTTLARQKAATSLGSLYSHAGTLEKHSRLGGLLEPPAVRRDAAKAESLFREGADRTSIHPSYPPALTELGEAIEFGGNSAGKEAQVFGFYSDAAALSSSGVRGPDPRAEQNRKWMHPHMGGMGMFPAAGGAGEEGSGWEARVANVAEKMERLVGDSMRF